ncbi:MAG: cytidine deaminase [Rudaea sp.]
MPKSFEELIAAATAARERAYAPYSKYPVGAAVLGKSGRVFTGCNVENVSFGLTVCAERTAILKAVSEGEREFDALAVVTSNGGAPCGACRQVIFEFASPDIPIVVSDTAGSHVIHTISELLASGFGPRDLPRA